MKKITTIIILNLIKFNDVKKSLINRGFHTVMQCNRSCSQARTRQPVCCQ